MKKTPAKVLGRFLANKEGEFYQDGDFHFDAMDIIRALGRNGFKIVKRRVAARASVEGKK